MGDRGSKKKDEIPNKIVMEPSIIKMYAQPGRLPLIWMIAYARIPENAPDIEAAEKNDETL